jgi:hypothetical protein
VAAAPSPAGGCTGWLGGGPCSPVRSSFMAASRLPASAILVASAASWLDSRHASALLRSASLPLALLLLLSPPPPSLKQRTAQGAGRMEAAMHTASPEHGAALVKLVSNRRPDSAPPGLAWEASLRRRPPNAPLML